MTTPAVLSTERGATMVRCPDCGRLLGELEHGNLVVKAGHYYVVMMLVNPTKSKCPNPKCGAWVDVAPVMRECA